MSVALDPHRVSQLHPALWVCGRHSIMKNAVMDEIESERRWSQSFKTSQRQLANLAREALEEELAGRTEPLDPDRL